MLKMSFIYFNIWQIKQTEPRDFAMGLIGFGKDIERSLLEATSPFVLRPTLRPSSLPAVACFWRCSKSASLTRVARTCFVIRIARPSFPRERGNK
jgi:hypothetical protein